MAPSCDRCRQRSLCTAAVAAAAAGSMGSPDAFVASSVLKEVTSAARRPCQGAVGAAAGSVGQTVAGQGAVWSLSLGPAQVPAAAAISLAASLAVTSAGRLVRRRPRGRLPHVCRAAEAASATTEVRGDTMVSPFSPESASPSTHSGEADAKAKPQLALTLENVELVLDEVRPYLQNDGGDCKVVEIDDTIVRLELQGACTSCSASSMTLKMGIERTLMERIPEVTEVVGVSPDQEPLAPKGVEEVLDGIRPFLSVSGGTIELHEIVEGKTPQVVLKMCGPPLKSMAVRVEVVNRIKRKYPQVQDVDIVSGDDTPPTSA